MPRLYSAREIVKMSRRAGFVYISQKGSHVKLRGIWKETLHTVIVPAHKEVARGTFQSILKQAGMSEEEFERFIK